MRKITLLLVPLLLTLSTTPALSEDAATLREVRNENRQVIRSEIEENRQAVREIRTENRQEVRSMVAENHANRLERRFTYYYNRLSGIATRLQKHLDTLVSRGKDVTLAKAKLTEAQTKLDSAKSLGEQAVAAFRAIDPAQWEEQKKAALAARDLANQTRTAFKDALVLFKSVLKEVK